MDIPTTIATLTAVSELTKAIINGKIDGKVKAKAIELNDSILSLQGTIFSINVQNHELLDAKREAEEKLMKLSEWKNTASNYELTELCPGVFVYAIKKDNQWGEPFHYICPNCYKNQQRSILTQSEMDFDGIKYSCNAQNCKAKYNDYSHKVKIQEFRHGSPY